VAWSDVRSLALRAHAWLPSLRDYVLVALGSAVTRVLSLVTAIVLARELGASSFGEVSVFFAFLVLWMGNDFLDVTFVRYANASEGERSTDYLRAIFILKSALNAVLLIASLPLSWVLATTAFGKPSLSTPIAAALLCGVGLNFLSLRAAMHQAAERFARYAGTIASFHVLTAITVVFLVLGLHQRATEAVYATYTAIAVVVGLYGVAGIRRTVRHLAFDKDRISEIVSFARWLFPANLSFLLFQQLDLFLVAAFASLASVGEYSAALRIVGAVALLTGTLAPALLPRATRASSEPLLVREYLKQSAVLSGGIVALALAAGLAAPTIVPLLFGSEYRDAAAVTQVLLVGTAMIAVYTPLTQLLLAYNEPRRMFHLSVLKLCVIGGAGVVLVPRLEGIGAALAVVLSDAAALGYVVLVLRRRIAAAFTAHSPATVS
jgi:O-antigen/teichoic acid export membrane protein